jgi:curli biogenesis system outer membrane secretion channel CsgG
MLRAIRLTGCAIAFALLAAVPQFAQAAATTAMPTVAVIPFSSEGLNVWWEAGFDPGGALADLLTDALVNGNKVSVVDRSHIDSVMQEKNLNLSGDISPATSMQLGRLVGAKYLIVGRIVQFTETSANSGALGGYIPGGFGGSSVKGEKVTLRVSSRVIEASTGRIVATIPEERSKVGTSFGVGGYSHGVAGGYSSQQFLSSSMGALINESAIEMAGKLDVDKLTSAPAGPSVSAHILTVEGADVVINKGSADGVAEGMFFDVFQTKSVMDPDSHQMTTVKIKKGTIQVVSTDVHQSQAKIVSGSVASGAAVTSE